MPVEVGCRGYTVTSAQYLFKTLDIRGARLKRASRDIAEEAEQGSFWLWLRRKDRVWVKHISQGQLQGALGRHPSLLHYLEMFRD